MLSRSIRQGLRPTMGRLTTQTGQFHQQTKQNAYGLFIAGMNSNQNRNFGAVTLPGGPFNPIGGYTTNVWSPGVSQGVPPPDAKEGKSGGFSDPCFAKRPEGYYSQARDARVAHAEQDPNYDPTKTSVMGGPASSSTEHNQYVRPPMGQTLKYWLPFIVFNPLILGIFALQWYRMRIGMDEDDERNYLQGSPWVAQARQAKRESLKDYKEFHYQQKDPKQEYDEMTYRRQNYTEVLKPSTYAHGADQIVEGEQPVKKMVRTKSGRMVGMYDSEGKSDTHRSYAGIRAYSEAQREEMEKKNAEDGSVNWKYATSKTDVGNKE